MNPAAVLLQPFDRRHLARTLEWTNDPELARLLDRARRIEAAEHEGWFLDLQKREDTAFFAIETGHDPTDAERRHVGPSHVGNVWLANIDRRHRKAEVRIVIGDRTATDRGVGAIALDLVARRAFEGLGLHRVYAYVLAFNPRARRAFEKAGFSLEGTLRDDRAVGSLEGSTAAPAFTDVFVLGRLAP